MQPLTYKPGTTLAGHYTVTGVLGTGGTAGVYLARDTVMNRTVAIKAMKVGSTASGMRNLMTEARAAAVLSHPNIVNVYDVLEHEGVGFIIMEYVCGITLKEYLAHNGHLSVKEAFNCAHQVLRALHAAHSRGIVHRDIKPANLLITTDGRIKVTDFGIARLPDGDSFLMPDRTVGTVQYISPEQASGGAVDERCDLYSLGIVLYEMLTGRRPFEAERPADVAMMHMTSRPQPPSELNSEIPPLLEKIILCALEKDPAARFDSAAEMLRTLDRLPEDVLSGRTRPRREEGSAYRLATERFCDDRTMPLPKSWFRRRADGEEAKGAAAPAEPPVPAAEEPMAPPPPPPPKPEPPPPVRSGSLLDAFTAEDTTDIMFPGARSATHPSVGEASEELPIFHRPTPVGEPPRETADEDATVELPTSARRERTEPKARARGGMLLGGESRFFGIFMLVAALILSVILIVGVVKELRDREDAPPESSVTLVLPQKESDRVA